MDNILYYLPPLIQNWPTNDLFLSVQEQASDFSVSLYPNPTSNFINVKTDVKLIGSSYTVYDNMGKAVLTGIINAENTVVEVQNLSGGIYLFRVGENNQQIVKVIKE